MHFGADVNGQNASGGIHARHKLFDQAADAEQLDQLFVELIQEPD